MTKIYEQHDKAFNQVSAYVLMRDDTQVGTIAIKYPARGEGRLYAYIHLHSIEMVRGFAGGYGYDKRSAAIEHAIRKIQPVGEFSNLTGLHGLMLKAAENMGSGEWQRCLEKQGFEVLRAI